MSFVPSPVPDDLFALFALPPRYALERDALEAAYERLTLAHHPDFFAGAPEAERHAAERISAAVNEGYRVLRDDAARAAYLLRRLAGDRPLDAQALPSGFLVEMFGLQEEVDELGPDGDPRRKAVLRGEADARREAILDARRRLFAALEAADGAADLARLQALQSNLNCERYLQRLLERLDGTEDGDNQDSGFSQGRQDTKGAEPE
jgi:molecular chaperone HscB